MPDREKVIAWLTEISLRPCDFTRDDFDAYETERLANGAIEIVEDAEIFCKQRNDALALLKEQEVVVRCKDCKFYIKPMEEDNVGDCLIKQGYFPVAGNWYCADAKRGEDDE